MTVIVIIVMMVIWVLCILLAALIGLGLAAWILSENYDALSDACADQASVWAWTAIALPAFAAGIILLITLKSPISKTPFPAVSGLWLGLDCAHARAQTHSLTHTRMQPWIDYVREARHCWSFRLCYFKAA